MEKLVLDGKSFVKASRAASALGYTSDYVGQLCRSGKVDAHLVGRTWYVNEEQLRGYKVEKKRSSRVKAREQVRKAVEEAEKENLQRLKVRGLEDRKAFESRITYEDDEKELMPAVKKLTVQTSAKGGGLKPKTKAISVERSDEPNYTIENEGEKIIMSGKLDITDATDVEPFDGDVVTMHAKIIKNKEKQKKEVKNKFIAKTKAISVEENADEKEEDIPIHTTSDSKTKFLARLEAAEEKRVANAENQFEEDRSPELVGGEVLGVAEDTLDEYREPAGSSLGAILVIVACLFIAVAQIIVEVGWMYLVPGENTPIVFTTSYSVDVTEASNLLIQSINP